MKHLYLVMVIIGSVNVLAGQSKLDSLWGIWNNVDLEDTARLDALGEIHSLYVLQTDPVYHIAKENEYKDKMTADKNHEEWLQSEFEYLEEKERMVQLSQYEKHSESSQRLKIRLLMGTCLLLIGACIVLERKRQKSIEEKKETLKDVEELREKLVARSTSTVIKGYVQTLDKEKIEERIGSKIGATSWKILNLIFEDPTLSNQSIAEKVSLSLEGVSSSLRRMYTSFEVKSTANKKLSLLKAAVRLSI